jgi:hypothetical protein
VRERKLCTIREGPARELAPTVSGERARLILTNAEKWVNGTVLRYAFFEDGGPWTGSTALKDQTREAFRRWLNLGIGLKIEEVQDRAQAQVRIGFQFDDGHWSYVGRQILREGPDDRTMNLDPLDGIENGEYGIDVACHEIGHTLGFPHEHQNPNAGIVWDEEAVYRALAAPPNRWSRAQTFHNIIRKIEPDEIQGSTWDPNSVMHYAFGAGLILRPEEYNQNGVRPAGGLSQRDREWVKTFYPPQSESDYPVLPLLTSQQLSIAAGQQRNFILRPNVTRYYELRTFGLSDTVMVLFERDSNQEELYLTGDDDSGEDRNAYIRRRLHAGREYVVRLRLYYAADAGSTGIMWW